MLDHWPLLGLRLATQRLELRLPTDTELGDLAERRRCRAAPAWYDPVPGLMALTHRLPSEREPSSGDSGATGVLVG